MIRNGEGLWDESKLGRRKRRRKMGVGGAIGRRSPRVCPRAGGCRCVHRQPDWKGVSPGSLTPYPACRLSPVLLVGHVLLAGGGSQASGPDPDMSDKGHLLSGSDYDSHCLSTPSSFQKFLIFTLGHSLYFSALSSRY